MYIVKVAPIGFCGGLYQAMYGVVGYIMLGGQHMFLVAFLRTIFFYFFLLVALRIMGKRELGPLGPLDLVVTIIMAEVAAIPIEAPERPLMLGVIPIATIVFLEIVLSYLCLKSKKVRDLISGRPSVVVQDGRMVQQEMRRLRYSVADLMEQLRIRGYHNVQDVEMAVLESDGELSVLPKSHKRPLSSADLGLPVRQEGATHTLIIDGQIDYEALRAVNLDVNWLNDRLAERGVNEAKDVLVAFLDGFGGLVVQQREEAQRRT